MSQQSVIWPLGIVASAVLVIVLALAAPHEQPAVALQSYPDATETPTAMTTPTLTLTPTDGTAETAESATETPTVTSTRTPTASATSSPTGVSETATPTPTIPADALLDCTPGEALWIEGVAPPSTVLLLYFGGQAVGGTVSDAQGEYAMLLVVGNERGGDYPLEVRVRQSGEIIQELVCAVPTFTPTPTPSLFRQRYNSVP